MIIIEILVNEWVFNKFPLQRQKQIDKKIKIISTDGKYNNSYLCLIIFMTKKNMPGNNLDNLSIILIILLCLKHKNLNLLLGNNPINKFIITIIKNSEIIINTNVENTRTRNIIVLFSPVRYRKKNTEIFNMIEKENKNSKIILLDFLKNIFLRKYFCTKRAIK